MPTKLTSKQREFVKQKLEHPGISNAKAMIRAGYSPNTAKCPMKNIMGKHSIQTFLEGIASDEILQTKLNEGLEAYKVDITGDHSPDFKTRLDYIKEMLGLKGYQKPELQVNQQLNVGTTTYVINTTKNDEEFNKLTSEPK